MPKHFQKTLKTASRYFPLQPSGIGKSKSYNNTKVNCRHSVKITWRKNEKTNLCRLNC